MKNTKKFIKYLEEYIEENGNNCGLKPSLIVTLAKCISDDLEELNNHYHTLKD